MKQALYRSSSQLVIKSYKRAVADGAVRLAETIVTEDGKQNGKATDARMMAWRRSEYSPVLSGRCYECARRVPSKCVGVCVGV